MYLYKTEYQVKISFEDLDPMNIVWHGNYIKYLEQARCDMLSKLGYTYIDIKNEGFGYPVAKLQVKYIKPATLGDILTVVTMVESIEPTLNLRYEILKTGEKIFEAKTMQICVKTEGEKAGESVYTAPKGLIAAIERVSEKFLKDEV